MRDSARSTGQGTGARRWVVVVALAAASASSAPSILGQQRGPADAIGAEWHYYGRDPGGQRFSPLTQITADNVATLTRAWSFDTGVNGLQVTPQVIGGVMYVAAGQQVYALEPETGAVKWTFSHTGISRRGLAYWPGDGAIGARFFTGGGDGRMIAIDVATGQLAAGFGTGGVVDLKASLEQDGVDGRLSIASPPVVYRNLVITGANNGEDRPTEDQVDLVLEPLDPPLQSGEG